VYFALGSVASGKQQWERAIASDSQLDNAISHSNLGEELVKAGAFDDALPHLRKALFATTRVYRRYSSEFQQSRLGTRLEGILPEFGKSDVISRTVDLRHYFPLATIRELASLPEA
jgi:tetratricopeptide (TPR) repeat protein